MINNWDEVSTTDPDQIGRWLGPTGNFRNASLAIDTGKSGLVVVDCDGPAGVSNWEEFRRTHNLSGTWVAHTPGGGQHWYYRADPERPVHNSTSKIAPKVDTRGVKRGGGGTGGCVIAPPSGDTRDFRRWGAEGEPARDQLPVVPVAVVDAINGKRVKLRLVHSAGQARRFTG